QVREFRCDVATEHVDDDRVAEMKTEAFRHLLLHRHQRRPGIVARPPFASDNLGALGRLVGEGDAPIAFQRPGDIVAGLDLFDRPVAKLHEAPAHHWRLADFDARGLAFHEVDEGARVWPTHIEEKEARRYAWLSLSQFGAHVGLDEGERDERREAKAKR